MVVPVRMERSRQIQEIQDVELTALCDGFPVGKESEMMAGNLCWTAGWTSTNHVTDSKYYSYISTIRLSTKHSSHVTFTVVQNHRKSFLSSRFLPYFYKTNLEVKENLYQNQKIQNSFCQEIFFSLCFCFVIYVFFNIFNEKFQTYTK